MPTARGDLTATSVSQDAGSDVFYVVGGFGTDFCVPLKTVEQYDVDTDSWYTKADLMLARADLAMGSISNHVFAVAGETKDSTCGGSNPGVSVPVNDVERLDSDNGASSDSGSWVVEEGIPGGRFRFVGCSYLRKLFLFGGQGLLNTSTTPAPTHHVLDTVTLYVPQSIADEDLSDGEIAGIVIAAVVAGGVVVLIVIAFCSYRGYKHYMQANTEQEEPTQTDCKDADQVNPVGAFQKAEPPVDGTCIKVKIEGDLREYYDGSAPKIE